jgi:hypothetical protein
VRPKRRFELSIRRRVVVHLNGGYSIDGVLGGIYADGVEVRSARYVRADEYDTPLDGTQVIPWQSVAWIQELADEPVRSGSPV